MSFPIEARLIIVLRNQSWAQSLIKIQLENKGTLVGGKD